MSRRVTLRRGGRRGRRPDERLVITLLELEGKSIREVAGMTGWSEANVKVRVFSARQKLRRILERDHGR